MPKHLALTTAALALLALTPAVASPASAAVACSSGYVALTFDDGPHGDPANTPLVLDSLKAKATPATFFFVGGMVDGSPHLARRALAEGHVLGNHTYDHPDLVTVSTAEVTSQFSRTNDAFARAGLPKPTLQRPPYGSTNDSVKAAGASLGLTQALWNNTASADWDNPTADEIRARVRSAVMPGTPNVVLLHDAWTLNTAAAVPGIIDDLRTDGYCFATLQPSSTEIAGVGNVRLVPEGTAPVATTPTSGSGKGTAPGQKKRP